MAGAWSAISRRPPLFPRLTLLIFARLEARANLFEGWNRLVLLPIAGLLGVLAVQAWRKWRLDSNA